MTETTANAPRTRSWIFYAALLSLFWGVWGAFSALPATKYDYPDEMIYSIWALTMTPSAAAFILRGRRWDRRAAATIYGLLIGLTGAGGQLILFQALTMGPAYIIFPIISISPAITVIMAMVLLRERLKPLPSSASSLRWRPSCCSPSPAEAKPRSRRARGCCWRS